ncbi:MAG: glycosyltransferase family 4 protein, partial [Pyrinomonadaceae bacterium]|nr:glycosyltransferase family 4 protein [Pyrinomonadaceae bacterium]
RFRLEQWETILRKEGVKITYAPFETERLRKVLYKPTHSVKKFFAIVESFKKRLRDVQSVKEYDLVYVFREAAILGPPWFERKIARSGVPIVFDFDDAIFVPYKSPANGYLSYLKFPHKTAEICRLSTQVIVGNQYLADYAIKFNKNVTIIPTTIDTEKYKVVKKNADKQKPTIGWSGSFSTVQHLDTIRNVFRELAKTETFRLRVIGTSNYEIPGVEVESMPWRSETEIQDLSDIDIGVMPLPDDEWSKGKCGLKALQYMALGIPTICSPVGVNSTIIQDGKNGFLANNEDEWIERLKKLLHSPELRKNLGLAGRKTVEENYSAKAQAPRVYKVFESALKSSSCE